VPCRAWVWPATQTEKEPGGKRIAKTLITLTPATSRPGPALGTAEKRPLGPAWPAHGTTAAPWGVHERAGAASRRAFARRRGFAATAAAFAPAAPKRIGKP
jgi:hypothetical protein